MTAPKASLLALILCALFGLLTYFVAVRGPVSAPTSDVGALIAGQMAPNFDLRTLDGRTVRLQDLRGQIVLINFWATWCQPCLDEMPSLQALHERFGSRKLVILGVNLNETAEDLVKYVQQAKLSFPILLDGQAMATRYGTEKVPETYLLDSRGIVIQKIVGPQDWSSAQILRDIEALLPE